MKLTVDGRSVFVSTGGRDFDPALPTVAFLHGAGMDHTVWALQNRWFAYHGFGVLAFDLPGHGRSEGAPLDSIGAVADWLTRALSAAGLAQAAVVGHSMGALVALEAAARYPDRVRALGLIGAAAAMPVHASLLDAARANSADAISMVTLWGFGRDAEIGGSRAPGQWMVGGGRRLLERAWPGVLYTDLAACNDYCNGLVAAAKVRCPTLLILGERDRMTPLKAGRELAGQIGGSRVVVIPDSGHMPMIEHPDAVLDALRAI
ncbi:MAG TPA: alpha/beta hydrolase [Azospirillaceae bacterium]|nr:alpha/beta hydrolase [Azospirillaceae bacterium]